MKKNKYSDSQDAITFDALNGISFYPFFSGFAIGRKIFGDNDNEEERNHKLFRRTLFNMYTTQ